jgi:hypothetical protein
MDIKESVLKFLYKNNNGRLANLYPVLLPFDNDRQGIRGTLFNLEKNGFIEIDNDYQKLVLQRALIPVPLSNITLLAKLSPKGETYYKEHYLNQDKLRANVKIKNLQNISNSTISGDVVQSSSNFTRQENLTKLKNPTRKKSTLRTSKLSKYILYPLIGGLILLVINLVLKYGFGITF